MSTSVELTGYENKYWSYRVAIVAPANNKIVTRAVW